MNILFMGTPEFASYSLDRLITKGYDVKAVVCQPDKPKGRGYELTPPPVKVRAITEGIEVFQPDTLKNEGFLKDLKMINPDVIVVVAYGKILPGYILDYPKYGCINLHASLLPKLRGASPIQWSIVTGEKVTGVTTMLMDKGLDTGDMLIKREILIDSADTAASLHDKLMVLGGDVLEETLEGLKKGNITPQKQPDGLATYAPIIKKEMAEIDWNKSVCEIYNLIRGMYSWPISYTAYNGETVKITCAEMMEELHDVKCGTICEIIKNRGIKVACKSGYIIIKRFKFNGKREMTPDEYIMGNSMKIGEVLG